MSPDEALVAVRGALTDELRRPPWRGSACPVAGHCYVAAEALYHLLGGAGAGWTPAQMTHEGGPHWYLRHRDGRVLDPTAAQFAIPPDYARGRGRGFLTREPSRRSRVILERVRARCAP